MAKKVTAIIKLQLPAGAATPAPPVGPALGQHGVNIMQFVKAYNEMTAAQSGTIIPVEITVFQDRSFTFITKTPPAAALLTESGRPEKRQRRTEQNQSRQHYTSAIARTGRSETAGFELQRRGRRHEDFGGHGAFDGY